METQSLLKTAESDVTQLITQWLEDRKELLVVFNELCNLKSHNLKKDGRIWLEEDLKELCRILVCYVNTGQFELFDKMISEIEQQDPQKNSLNKIITNKLLFSTLTALDFKDKYEDKPNLSTLKKDLSQLGEVIAQRLEWEDALIDAFNQNTEQATI